jgi:signal peptidase I
MEQADMQENSRPARWIKNLVDIAVIVLIVVAAKTAIAEPFYVPSGSMEPTLLIGDELLATQFLRVPSLLPDLAEHGTGFRDFAQKR